MIMWMSSLRLGWTAIGERLVFVGEDGFFIVAFKKQVHTMEDQRAISSQYDEAQRFDIDN